VLSLAVFTGKDAVIRNREDGVKRMATSLLAVMFLGIILPALAGGQARAGSEKLRVVYSAIGSSQSPLWITHEAQIFRKYGLDVDLLYVGGGSRAAQVILSGEVPVAMFNGGSVISADLSGADLVNIASGMNVLPFFLVVGPGVKQVEELKGKKVAVTRIGSSTDFALCFAAEKWPVKPDRDFTVLQLGGQPEMMAALKSGAVQGAMLNAEFTILARRENYRELADVGSMGLKFPGSGLNTGRSFIRNRRETVLRLLRAYTDAIHYGRTQKSFSINVLGKYLKNQDKPFLEAVYDLYIGNYIPKIPYPSVEAMKQAMNDIAEKDPRGRGLRPEQFIDASLMQELEKSGFTRQLWR
jgi:sulfonate transport system substrate-binding protein